MFGRNLEQQEIDQAEWENPGNWTGWKWCSIYFSKRDSRVWVPKEIRWLGWTLNLGRPGGVAWLLAIVVGAPLIMILGVVLALSLM